MRVRKKGYKNTGGKDNHQDNKLVGLNPLGLHIA